MESTDLLIFDLALCILLSFSAWVPPKDLSKLKKHEIEAYINEPHKKNGELLAGYRIALDPSSWEREMEKKREAAEEAEADEEVDELEGEEEAGDDEGPAKTKKRKRDSEGGTKAKSKAKKDKDGGETSSKKKKSAEKGDKPAKSKKNGTKSKEVVESEDEGEHGGKGGSRKKASPPPAKKSKRDKDDEGGGESQFLQFPRRYCSDTVRYSISRLVNRIGERSDCYQSERLATQNPARLFGQSAAQI